jgi:hypothetical protein
MAGPPEKDIHLAAALGRATGAWAMLEGVLTLLFAVLTKLNMGTASAIFDLLKSTAQQREVLVRMSKFSPRATDEHRATLRGLINEYGQLAERRNEVMHNPYGWADAAETSVFIALKTKGPRVRRRPLHSAAYWDRGHRRSRERHQAIPAEIDGAHGRDQ